MEFRCQGFDGRVRVRYCNLGEYGYLVGAEFAGGCGWDKERWQPKHMISVSEIADG